MELTKRMSKCAGKFSSRCLGLALIVPNESKQLESNSMKNQKTKSFSPNKKLNAHQSISGIIYAAYIMIRANVYLCGCMVNWCVHHSKGN